MRLGGATLFPVLLAALLGASPVLAQQIDEASRSAARQLGYEGLEAYRAGRYPEALDKLGRAYAVVKAPSLGLWTARAMVQAGKLVEASERLLEVTRLPVSGGDEALQTAAKETAAKERNQLAPRIPHVRIEIEGADAATVNVTLDGRTVPTALLGLDHPVNPGRHELRGAVETRSVVEVTTLSEGQTRAMVLRFAPGEKSAAELATEALPFGESSPSEAPPPAPTEARSNNGALPGVAAQTASGTGASARPAMDQPTDDGTNTGGVQRSFGWVAVGLGSAGLGVGAATGIMAMSKKDDLDSGDCLSHVCGPREHDQVDAYNSLRTASTVGFVIGGLGLAAGWTLLLTAPDHPEANARVTPWVGVASAGVAGRF